MKDLTQPPHALRAPNLVALHLEIAEIVRARLDPSCARALVLSDAALALEHAWLEEEVGGARARAALAPTDPSAFLAWLADLVRTGPGQEDPLFGHLEHAAAPETLRWYLAQEQASETGLDRAVELTLVRAKLEGARDGWMSPERAASVEAALLAGLEQEPELTGASVEPVWEALALSNLVAGLALHREHGYRAMGAIGIVELTAGARYEAVARGIARISGPDAARRYLELHHVGVRSRERWNEHVLVPLIEAEPDLAPFVAEGALARLGAGKRFYDRCRIELGLSSVADTTLRVRAPEAQRAARAKASISSGER